MEKYTHTVQYYETDKMGIVHHSNYIRWMEEARVDFLRQIGWDCDKLEDNGIASPVIGVTCDYKISTKFPEKIDIDVSVKEFKGVKLFLEYKMTNASGSIVCSGTSSHAFLNTEGKPIRMKQEYPELYSLLNELATA